MFGIRQLCPTRSPAAFLYSLMGLEDAPMYLPWLGRITFAKRDSRQNWYTTSVDWPQFASTRHLSMRMEAPSSRVNSIEMYFSVSSLRPA